MGSPTTASEGRIRGSLLNTGSIAMRSHNRLLTTIACGPRGEVNYALEGAIFNGGSTVQWLRDGLQMIKSASEVEALASQVPDTDGVVVVPAFVGLGAPYWRADARACFTGMSLATGAGEFVRAVVEGVAAQIVELLRAIQKKRNLAYLFISHDLKVVKALAHHILVMKDGQVVEEGPADDVFAAPKRSYTRTLFAAAFHRDGQ